MSEPVCMVCAGAGTIIVARSWFASDGYTRVRCGICSGSGESAYIAHGYAAEQARARAAIAKAPA